jgi:hypothetical protein
MSVENKDPRASWTWHGLQTDRTSCRHPGSCVNFLNEMQKLAWPVVPCDMGSAWIEASVVRGLYDDEYHEVNAEKDEKHPLYGQMKVCLSSLQDYDDVTDDNEFDHLCEVELISINTQTCQITVRDSNNNEYIVSQECVVAFT